MVASNFVPGRVRRRRPRGDLLIVASCLALVFAAGPSSPAEGIAEIAGYTLKEEAAAVAKSPSLSLAPDRRTPASEKNFRRVRRRTQGHPVDTCREGFSLHPGESLVRGEFLCHGDLRFGIDAAGGRFILGFAPIISNSTNSSGFGANISIAEATVAGVGAAAPVSLAWRAQPTTLFIEDDRSFSYVTLSDDGNILGYDATGFEIYDSNYDYYNKKESKEDESILVLKEDCRFLGNILPSTEHFMAVSSSGGGNGNSGGNDNSGGNNKGGERMCVALMSPQIPGMPHGMVTWAVTVHPGNIMSMESLAQSPDGIPEEVELFPTHAPAADGSLEDVSSVGSLQVQSQPTPRPTHRTRWPTAVASAAGQLADSPSNSPTNNSNNKSIIWGTVWLDSNQNGEIDRGEDTVSDLQVKLYECTDSHSTHKVGVTQTDNEGMYFFKVRTRRTYMVKFNIDNEVHGYSSGIHTHNDMRGWTSCVTSKDESSIQWNAGLYELEDDKALVSAETHQGLVTELFPGDAPATGAVAETEAEPVSSIGGFVYLDVNESGHMDTKERSVAVGGYTVDDAVVEVTLTDCKTNKLMASHGVYFPGTYAFGNLTEGLYKLRYEMLVLARNMTPDAPVPLYTFVDGNEDSPLIFETECRKLGKGVVIDSGNVGLRMQPLELTPKISTGPVGPPTNVEEETSASSPGDNGVAALAIEEEGVHNSNDDDGGSFVPGLVGALVTLSVVVVAFAFYIKHRGGRIDGHSLSPTFPFLVSTKSHSREDLHSIGSSVDGDNAATPSANQTAIGSLIVETGNTIVAGLTVGGELGDGSDSSEEGEDHVGMEFALKASTGRIAGGEKPHQNSSFGLSSDVNSNYNVEQKRKEEEGSEGYEVYDNEDDEERGENEANYGPVISGMIARHAQKQQDATHGNEEDARESHQGEVQLQDYMQGLHPQDQSQNDYSQYHEDRDYQSYKYQNQHHQWEHFDEQTSTSGSSRSSSDPPAASYKDIPNAASSIAGGGWDSGCFQHQAEDYRQYIVEDESSAYHQDYQQHQGHPRYSDYEASGDKHHLAIVPSGINGDDDQVVGVAHFQCDAGYHQQQDRGRVFDSNSQYPPYGHSDHNPSQYNPSEHLAGGDEVYAAGYESNHDEGTYPINYDQLHHRQYAPNNEQGAYEQGTYGANHGEQQHQDDRDDLADSSSSSSEEVSTSGWSSSSSTTNSSAVSGMSSMSGSGGLSSNDPSAFTRHFRPHGSSTIPSKARRAQSNPRDDRRIASWRHQAAIPEHSTLEYNAYTMSHAAEDDVSGGGGGGDSGFAPPSQSILFSGDDNKSVLSSGSDQSADPPGASYKNLNRFLPPPPPRRATPPRSTTPPHGRVTPPRRQSPSAVPARRTMALPHGRATPPRRLSPGIAASQRTTTPSHAKTTTTRQPSLNANTAAAVIATDNARRGRSIPPPPPRGRPSPPPPMR